MKAAVYDKYGPPDVLRLAEVPKPTPDGDEILIKIRATTVSSADWRARSLEVPAGFKFMARVFFGISRPRQPILGTELAGDVESVGEHVTKFKAGDPVFAFCGAGLGCHAEYRCVPENAAVARKPANLSYDEAAALSFGGTTALAFFRKAKIQRGEKVTCQWCVWKCGRSRCTACEALRCTGDRRVQCSERGVSEIAGRPPRHRSHERGFHEKWRNLRHHRRHSGHGSLLAPQRITDRERPPSFGSGHAVGLASGSLGVDDEPQDTHRRATSRATGGCTFSCGSCGKGGVQAGHRSAVHTRVNCRGTSVCRHGSQERQCRRNHSPLT